MAPSKVTLEFDNECEADESVAALKAHDLRFMIGDLDNHLRSLIKYPNFRNDNSEYIRAAEEIRAFLHDLAVDRGLTDLVF